jgi:hypothetical protein
MNHRDFQPLDLVAVQAVHYEESLATPQEVELWFVVRQVEADRLTCTRYGVDDRETTVIRRDQIVNSRKRKPVTS